MHTHTRHPIFAALALVGASLVLLGTGAFAAVARSGGTYVDLGAHGSYATDRYALATESTNWRNAVLGWAGSVRLRIAAGDGKPVFVGVAPADTLGRYLSGTGYTTVGEQGDRSEHHGGAPARPPMRAVDWTADAEGAGTQTLSWKASAARQVAFAMNADRSRPVRVKVVSSAVTLGRMPWWVPAGLIALGVVLLPAGIGGLRSPIRDRTRS